jgi:hypothetical protein
MKKLIFAYTQQVKKLWQFTEPQGLVSYQNTLVFYQL